MRTSRSVVGEKPRILIIDRRRLRQAGIIRLLETWAGPWGLLVTPAPTENRLKRDKITAHCKMVVLSLGNASLEDPQQHDLIENIRAIMPRAALVIFSDREEPEEVRAALQEGAAGFMPSSTDPSVAFEALSFIKSGGSFFPRSALLDVCHSCTPLGRSVGTQRSGHDSELTPKQTEVFNVLRKGQSNKVIARRLGMSEATVKVHVRCIMRKFGVGNRTQLAVAALNDHPPTNSAVVKDGSEGLIAANVTQLHSS
jgi:DNA-binding NarL/FixJ family response regulator